MTKHYREYEVPAQPAKTEKSLIGVTCDICKRTYESSPCREDTSWSGNHYEVIRTIIKSEKGDHDGGNYAHIEGVEYHACPGCFKNKLEPWLQEQGAVPHKTLMSY